MQFLKLRKPLTALLLSASIGSATAQNLGFDPPKDFKDDIPERETKVGHIVYLKTFFDGCVVKDSQNKDSINPNCAKFKQAKTVTVDYKYAIEDISWIKYFTILEKLEAPYNYIKVLPDTFPSTLKSLELTGNLLSLQTAGDFPHLPKGLEMLNVSNQRSGNFKTLPVLPDNLKILAASANQLTSLPDSLPSKLERLLLSSNQITVLNEAFEKSNLKYAIFQNNKLTSLGKLPSKIETFIASENLISSFTAPELPGSLTYLDVSRNSLSNLPSLNFRLKQLSANNNQLTSLPELPDSLITLNISENQIASLPVLPPKLNMLAGSKNKITALPALPQSLSELWMDNNKLTSLPTLPDSLKILIASYNLISGDLGTLPKKLIRLEISNTDVSAFTAYDKIEILDFSKTKVNIFPYATLPSSLRHLSCQFNNLPSIPRLPVALNTIAAKGNQFLCLPNLPASLYETDMRAFCNKNCWISPGGGDWKDGNNWSYNHAPTSSDSLLIINSTVSLAFESGEAKYLDIRNSKITGPSGYSLNIYGGISGNSSQFDVVVNLVGTTTQYIAGNPNFKKLNINNPQGAILEGPYIEDLSINNGYIYLTGLITIDRIGQSKTTNPNPVTGKIRYKQKINKGWSFIGSPFANLTLADLDKSIPLGFGEKSQSVYAYDGTKTLLNGWVKSTGLNESYTLGKGFRVYNQTTSDLSLEGTPFVGTKNLNVTFNAAGYDGGGWNLVANPYFCEIDWRLISNKVNMNEAIYIWNPSAGSYSSYVNNLETNGGSPLIQKGQAFFVKASGASPKLIVDENSKPLYPGYAPFFRTSATSSKLRIVLNDDVEKLTDELLFSEVEESSNNFDSKYDAYKLPGTYINISTKSSDGEDLSISSIPALTGSYPLQISAARTGKFSFSFKNVETLDGTSAYLIDKLLGKEIEITNDTKYEFTANTTETPDRFKVSFSSVVTGNTSSIAESAPIVYPNPAKDQVTVTLGRAKNADVVLINPMGSEIAQWSNVQEGSLQMPLSAGSGVYILKVKSNEEIFVYKIVKF